MVWAFDGHIDETESHQSMAGDHDLSTANSQTNDQDDHPGCDHCCHASAHIIALRSAARDNAFSNASHDYSPYQQSLLVHSNSPPQRPPKA